MSHLTKQRLDEIVDALKAMRADQGDELPPVDSPGFRPPTMAESLTIACELQRIREDV